MKKIYHLSTCSTCARILKEIKPPKDYILQDIKTDNISGEDLDKIKKIVGTYEALFSKIALKYRAWGLNEKKLTEKDFRKYILEEYTFLKRPVIVDGNKVFVGNSKKTVEEAKAYLKK
jgi:arsenate reductase (glutaredoxin)